MDFPFPVAIFDYSSITVQKKLYGEANYRSVDVRSITQNANKNNSFVIALNQEITPYTDIWKVVLPAGTFLYTEWRALNQDKHQTNELHLKYSDVYSWTESQPSWPARSHHEVLVYKDKIWIMGGWVFGSHGGVSFSDVWNSSDGRTWKLVNNNPSWQARRHYSATSFNGMLWVKIIRQLPLTAGFGWLAEIIPQEKFCLLGPQIKSLNFNCKRIKT